jgi:hypothetical protein
MPESAHPSGHLRATLHQIEARPEPLGLVALQTALWILRPLDAMVARHALRRIDIAGAQQQQSAFGSHRDLQAHKAARQADAFTLGGDVERAGHVARAQPANGRR